MSESISDDNAYLQLNFENGSSFNMDRWNSRLYTFYGKVALHGVELDAAEFDHIFLRTGEGERDDGVTLIYGHHIFKQSAIFDQLSDFMLEYDFPATLNETVVPDGDIAAWEKCQVQDISDYIPDDFFEI